MADVTYIKAVALKYLKVEKVACEREIQRLEMLLRAYGKEEPKSILRDLGTIRVILEAGDVNNAAARGDTWKGGLAVFKARISCIDEAAKIIEHGLPLPIVTQMHTSVRGYILEAIRASECPVIG